MSMSFARNVWVGSTGLDWRIVRGFSGLGDLILEDYCDRKSRGGK